MSDLLKPGADKGTIVPDTVETISCTCGKVTITFDPEAAEGLDEFEVRKRWPRGHCNDCKLIFYTSAAHYIAGDW